MLLSKIANFNNLYLAYIECSKGKRQKRGFQNFLFNHGEKLKLMEAELLETKTYNWNGYREFEVIDPKKRIIMAAPFKDRVLHTAIHRKISPTVDRTFGARAYACRLGKGNRNASLRLYEQLKFVGKNRYCIKLDVKKYFPHIDHHILQKQLFNILDDSSIISLMKGLIASHPRYQVEECGIPIGNLTSQLFANLYLSPLDKLACKLLDIDFENDSVALDEKNFYIRYMDDMIILAESKKKAFFCANALIKFAENELKLSIPQSKKVILADDPIPFLGFIIDENGLAPLARNRRKFIKKIKRMNRLGVALSEKAMVEQSYRAWKNL